MNTDKILQELGNHLTEARTIIERLRNGEFGELAQDFAEAEDFNSIEECENIVDDYLN